MNTLHGTNLADITRTQCCVHSAKTLHYALWLTTMLSTPKHVPTLSIIIRAPVRMTIKGKGDQHQWLAGGYDLGIGHF